MAFEDLFIKLLDKHAKRLHAQVTIGTVKDVDLTAYTCTISRDGLADLIDVRLNSCVYQGGRMVTIPANGSKVLTCLIDNDKTEACIISYGEVDKVLIQIGTVTFELNADGTLIQKGDESLNKILKEFVAQLLKIYAPKDVAGITALEARIDNLLK